MLASVDESFGRLKNNNERRPLKDLWFSTNVTRERRTFLNLSNLWNDNLLNDDASCAVRQNEKNKITFDTTNAKQIVNAASAVRKPINKPSNYVFCVRWHFASNKFYYPIDLFALPSSQKPTVARPTLCSSASNCSALPLATIFVFIYVSSFRICSGVRTRNDFQKCDTNTITQSRWGRGGGVGGGGARADGERVRSTRICHELLLFANHLGHHTCYRSHGGVCAVCDGVSAKSIVNFAVLS